MKDILLGFKINDKKKKDLKRFFGLCPPQFIEGAVEG